jgi:tRNA(Ile)-lysidine synthase
VLRRVEAGWRRVGGAGRRALLAVSGGADSLGMLLATREVAAGLGLGLEVACVDHGLRPGAAREQQEVGALCARLGLPFHPLCAQVPARGNLEAEARAARYAALEACRRGRGLDVVATAHTREDQVETLLLRLGRGADLRGAAAIRETRGAVVRPLLQVGRADLRRWVEGQGGLPAEDPMNRDPRFARVKVRQLLPALEQALGRGALGALARFAARAAEDEAWLESEAATALGRLRLDGGGWDAVGLAALPLPLRRRALRGLLEREGLAVDAALLDAALDTLVEAGRLTLPRGYQLRTAGGRVRLVQLNGGPAAVPTPEAVHLVEGAGWDHVPSGWHLGLGTATGDAAWCQGVPGGPLEVRAPLPGDLLAGGGRLQDLLVDARVPAEQRPRVPVIVDAGGRVICAVGVGPSTAGRPGGRVLLARPMDGRASVRQAGYIFVLEGGAGGSAE